MRYNKINRHKAETTVGFGKKGAYKNAPAALMHDLPKDVGSLHGDKTRKEQKTMDIKAYLAEKISALCALAPADVSALLEKPKDEALGDAAFPCFTLARTMKKAPPLIAKELAENLTADRYIERSEAVGGYLNIFFNRQRFVSEAVGEVLGLGDAFGKSNIGEGKTVVVDFSSPNIAKPFHIGHLFSTALGNSLSNIYAALGYRVERVNHLGDWGTQFGKLICAYKHWGNEEAVKGNPIDELTKLYVRFHKEAEENPALEDEARAEFHLLEEGNEENLALWRWFREVGLDEFKRVYDLLGVTFDSYNGEAFYLDKMDRVIRELEEAKLLEESDGAQIVTFDDMPPAILLKQDGSTIYTTRDLAAAEYRADTYHFDKNIYVVGLPQKLHFQQIFTILEKMGKPYAKDCLHVAFGTVKFASGAMSTRSGNVVLLETVLSEAEKKTADIMRQNGNSEEEIATSAALCGIGAVFYTFLKNSREKDIIFDWDDILDFDGESGPYVLYSYARGRSVLRKADASDAAGYAFDHEITDEEYTLCKLLSEFPDAVALAALKNEPFYVTRYVTALAKAFNKFYNTSPILKAEPKVRRARLSLTEATCQCLKSALALLGIRVVERM